MLSQNKGLRKLNMNQCSLGQDGCLYLSLGFLKNTTLKQLTLASNNFGDEGIEHISQFILSAGHDFKLEHLDLSNNFITDEQGIKLGESLEENRNLKELILQSNTLTYASGEVFKEVVTMRNYTLAKVDLSLNLVPIRLVNEITEKCLSNTEGGDEKLVLRLRREYKK